MTETALRVDRRDDGVVVLTLDLPDRRNAMTGELTASWGATIAKLRGDRSVRCFAAANSRATVASREAVLRLFTDVHPGVHVWRAPKIPKHCRAFNLPHVPYPIVANVLVLVKSHVQIIKPVFLH